VLRIFIAEMCIGMIPAAMATIDSAWLEQARSALHSLTGKIN
jgi:hypothetical protein